MRKWSTTLQRVHARVKQTLGAVLRVAGLLLQFEVCFFWSLSFA